MSYASFNPTLWQTIKAAIIQKPGYNWLEIPATSVTLGDFGAGPYCYRMAMQFNLTATGNFCVNLPLDTFEIEGGLLAVRYRVGWTTSYRYRLTKDENDTESDPEILYLSFPEEEYTGQIIKKNAVLELWGYPGALVISMPAFNLPISIKSFPAIENTDLAVVSPTFVDSSASFPFSPLSTIIQPSDYWLDNA